MVTKPIHSQLSQNVQSASSNDVKKNSPVYLQLRWVTSLWLLGVTFIIVLSQSVDVPLTLFSSFLPPCGFKLLFHLPCPFCGLTRGILSAAQGDFINAWQYHPFSIPLIVLAPIISFFTWVLPVTLLSEISRSLGDLLKSHHRLLIVLFLALILGYWSYKLTASPQWW